MQAILLTIFVVLMTGSASFAHAALNRTNVNDAELSCSIVDRPRMVESLGAEGVTQDADLKLELNGQIVIGIRFYMLRKCGLFASIGFQIDDIITKVEDTAVNSPVGFMIFFDYLKGGQPFHVTVLRGGRTVNFEIK
jgi:type II secretory pathway component PulC